MDLTLLGTGNALVTRCYNTCFLLSEGDDQLLVDGGGGNTILSQLERTGTSWRDVHAIFVTHRHIDHLLGIVWMMRMICQHMRSGSYEGEAVIYAHDEVVALLERLAGELLQAKDAALVGKRLHLVTVSDGETLEIMGHDVTFFDIQSTKAKQFGFRMELGEGRSLVCCGDEPYNPCERVYAEGATWLLHEAFCLASQADVFHPYEKSHSTVADACTLAEELGVENLVLYHTEDKNIDRREELYRAEGAPLFHGNLFIPNDLDVLHL